MDRSRINCHVKPLIGSRSAIGLTTDDLERLQTGIAAGRSARARNGGRGGITQEDYGVASRTLGMFEVARRKKVISVNPARDVVRLREGKQERYLTTEEIGRLGSSIADIEREDGNHVGLIATRFLLTSGVRRMEGLALPVSRVDAKANCTRFSDSKRARGVEGGSRVEFRPIRDSALQVLDMVLRPEGCPWAFPGYAEKRYVGLPNLLARVCARAGLEDVTVHVLRHSFSTIAQDLGYSEFVIAGLLGHRFGGMTGRYGQVPDKTLVAAANHVSCAMSAALNGRMGPGLEDRAR